jgi:Spy/CpxP family protein refolding chaperone
MMISQPCYSHLICKTADPDDAPKGDAGSHFLRGIIWAGITCITILTLGTVLTADAQPERPMLREHLRDRVNTIMIAKLDEYLDLSMEQAEQFFPKFRHFNNRREELAQSRREAMDDLIRVEDSEPDNEKRIEEQIDRLESIDGDMINLNREFRKEVRSILTPRQRARFVIFTERFPEQVRRIIEDVRRERGERGEEPPPMRR